MCSVSRQSGTGINRADERKKVTVRREGEKRCEISNKSIREREGEMWVVTLNHLDIHLALELVSESTYSHIHTHIDWQNRIWEHCSIGWMCPSSYRTDACCSRRECTLSPGAEWEGEGGRTPMQRTKRSHKDEGIRQSVTELSNIDIQAKEIGQETGLIRHKSTITDLIRTREQVLVLM